MNTRMIDGKCYAQMLMGGAAQLAAHKEELNALNVFPVPDGDTGTNMSRTFEGGLAVAAKAPNERIGEMSKSFANAVLLSARGNSGVILSQIFAGINEYLQEFDKVDAAELARAYQNGIKKSYAAVQNPTEGTILTVFRESTEYAVSNLQENSSIEDFYRLHIDEARRSLASTKDRLAVLAEADVVDSGAAGYVYIAQGMYETLTGKALPQDYTLTEQRDTPTVDLDSFTRDSVLEHGYCTEMLLRLTTAKVDPDHFDIKTIISILEEMGGDSIVAYKQEDIVKIHVHTFTPGEVMARVQAFGEFLTIKVENMSLGHSDAIKQKPKKTKKFSVVAVASGDGMSALFTQMGADHIISGGQTANPSTEEFLEAFRQCSSEHIIVLPNNKNVILAASQAAKLYEGAQVHIVETKNLMQGYCALSVITPGITDIDALVNSASRAGQSVTDCEVTQAVRDANIDGFAISQGDYIAISGGKIVATAENAEDAVKQMLCQCDADLCEIITLFVGKHVSDENRAALTEQLTEQYGDCQIVVYEGGQEVYDYFLAVE